MRYIIFAILMTVLLFSTNSSSQPSLITGKKASENGLMQNYPNPFINNTAIEFTLKDENFVKLYVTDIDGKIITTLAEGEADSGKHCVYFKTGGNVNEIIYKCRLEIYSKDKSSVIFADERIMNVDLKESGGIK
ncbi:MAG: hypothetical protein IPL53_14060 [Ignavibacteria bacterium]|nr:hypothetical protein [Ignavibacteria bacterium]